MKVILAINSIIGPSVRGEVGKEGYQAALGLLKNNVLGRVFCLGVTDDSELPPELVEPFCRSRTKERLLGLVNRLHRRYPGLRGRRRIEQWMDSDFSKKIRADNGNILYCPKPLYPKTIGRAKQLGMKTIVETSVLHPRFNLDLVRTERERLQLHGTAGYVDEARVANIECALERADFIFAWSSFIRESYIRYGVPADKIFGGETFKPPGVDTDRFCPARNGATRPFTVLHLSSISVIKGVQYLLEAWHKVADKIEGRLVLAGPIDNDMRRIIAQCTIKHVEWIGRTNDPAACYRNASVFVSPSVSDAGPRTVLESMACGVPAIVSSHCGISEIIKPGQNGMVYQWNNVDELASLILKSYENQDALQTMGTRARETALAYSVGDYTTDVLTRIYTVLGRPLENM